jgi:signal transduction histidine kinase
MRARVLPLLLRPTPPPLGLGIAVAAAFVAAETLVAYPVRRYAPEVSLGVVYLLGVLVVALVWGLALGAATSVVSATAFDFFHVPPHGSFVPDDPTNWVVLGVLLAVAFILASIADLARRRAIEADERRGEADLAAEMARLLLRANDLRSALPGTARRLAQALQLPAAAIELEAVPGDERRAAFPLRDGDTRIGTLLVDAGLARTVERRLRERVVPSVEALLRTAREREAMRRALEASRDELRLLAEEQAALRRVATLVARAVSPSDVLDAVAAEVGGLLGADSTSLLRDEKDGTATVVAYRSEGGGDVALGSRAPTEGGSMLATVMRTRRGVRVDSGEGLPGLGAALARDPSGHFAIGTPIVVEDRVWGAMIAIWAREKPPAAGTEGRMAEFTELIATAIANAASRDELAASRARVVATADETRRRIERDLHDGAQQRLVSLGLELRAAQDAVPPELGELRAQLTQTTQRLGEVVHDLLEISRGIHPATLSRGGLGPALKTLARRSAVPVALAVRTDDRLPAPVEVAAYYVVSEALTNAAKHARASAVEIDVQAAGSIVRLTIRDDGVGGADPSQGSGLLGLRDRIEALGGKIDVASPPGSGTSLVVSIPIDVA